MPKARKCVCGHTWNAHDALKDSHGNSLVVCMEMIRYENPDGWAICDCKEWRPVE